MILMTTVHCTYTQRQQLDELAGTANWHVCVCPTPEAREQRANKEFNLGNGVTNNMEFLVVQAFLIGIVALLYFMRRSSQNNRNEQAVHFTSRRNEQEEERAQMNKNSRNCAQLNATKLLTIATVNGASALQLDNRMGTFQVGNYFDFVAFDLLSPRLQQFVGGDKGEQLADVIVFGSGNAEIVMTAVAGRVMFRK
uniref:Amidohydrolase-related domain-containing protein n=1 Tax=Ditylenchus dipsaci TaxID=166011 RepID=A0A915DVR8_9BILA